MNNILCPFAENLPRFVPLLFSLDCCSSKYVLVRYEDVTQALQLTASFLYCALGLGDVPAAVSIWVEHNSKLTSCSKPPTRRLLAAADQGTSIQTVSTPTVGGEDCEQDKKSAHDKFGTKRDSASMADKWRSEATDEFSRSVWEACQDSGVMAELRYSY